MKILTYSRSGSETGSSKPLVTLTNRIFMSNQSLQPRNKDDLHSSVQEKAAIYVSQENFENLCSHSCNEENSCNLNISSIKPYDCIFISTKKNNSKVTLSFLYAFGKIKENIRVPFSIVTSNQYLPLPYNDWVDSSGIAGTENMMVDFSPWLSSAFLNRWFTTNCYWKGDFRPLKLSCIPIGIDRPKLSLNFDKYKFVNFLNEVDTDTKPVQIKSEIIRLAFWKPLGTYILFGDDDGAGTFERIARKAEMHYGWKYQIYSTFDFTSRLQFNSFGQLWEVRNSKLLSKLVHDGVGNLLVTSFSVYTDEIIKM